MTLLLPLLAACTSAPAPDAPATPAPAGELDVRVVVLGSGTPIPDPDRSGPALALTVGGKAYLIDAGPGVVRRAAAAATNGEDALIPDNLDRVFLTHLHSDHTAGLPDLWLTPWVVGRDVPLNVHGPVGTKAMTGFIEQAWAADLRIRTEGTEHKDPTGAGLLAHEVTAPGRIYEDELVKVDAIEVPHGDWESAYGYRFEVGDKVVVFSGDTTPTPRIVEACNGCDLLVHEVYSAAAAKAISSPEFEEYHTTFHTSTDQLAALARQAKPKRLLLVHQLHMGATDGILVREITMKYAGSVQSAKDLDVIEL